MQLPPRPQQLLLTYAAATPSTTAVSYSSTSFVAMKHGSIDAAIVLMQHALLIEQETGIQRLLVEQLHAPLCISRPETMWIGCQHTIALEMGA